MMTNREINLAIAAECRIKGDFVSNLNAMHKAEDELSLDEKDIYAQNLTEMFHGPGWSFVLIHATARQRAEAFLRTRGEWKE